jgi:solute carrier family 25 aspartate/glutamate transporter 12/13
LITELDIDFTEFAVFDLLTSKPDAEFEIAFRVFDRNGNGKVSKSDVVKTLEERHRAEPGLQGFSFDPNCQIMQRFFGVKGDRMLRPSEFAQFFTALTEEVPKQLFQYYDQERKGYILGDAFTRLITDFGYSSWRMPEGIRQRLFKIKNLNEDNLVVTYPEFIAFNEMLNRIL